MISYNNYFDKKETTKNNLYEIYICCYHYKHLENIIMSEINNTITNQENNTDNQAKDVEKVFNNNLKAFENIFKK